MNTSNTNAGNTTTTNISRVGGMVKSGNDVKSQKGVLATVLRRLSFSLDPVGAHHLLMEEDETTNDLSDEVLKSRATAAMSPVPKRINKKFRFCEQVMIGQAHSAEEYDRRPDFILRITPDLARTIKAELNDFKANEMAVHEEARSMTHFYKM
jgi:hypothetical protein